jgi:hypothetical protein
MLAPPKNSSAVYGGSLAYAPTPFLTLFASLDEALGVSTAVVTPTSIFGTDTRNTAALLAARYAMVEYWNFAVRAGYVHTDYVSTIFHDNGWLAGGTWSYFFWRNLALTLDYQYWQLHSNVPLLPYTRQVVTGGVTWRY